jgi:hypothetical protein
MKPEVDISRHSWWSELGFYLVVHPAGVVGVFIVSFFVGSMLEKVFGVAVDRLFISALYPLPVILGFATGLLLNRYLRSRSATLVFVLGALLVSGDLRDAIQRGGFHELVHYLSVTNCGGCEDQAFILCPFYISVAYSVGAWIGLKYMARPVQHGNANDPA